MDLTRFGFVTFGFGDQYTENVGGLATLALGAVALNLGDIVFWNSTADTVTKSTTATDYKTFAGVVIGGDLTYGKAVPPNKWPATGTIAVVSAGKLALIQTEGITKMIAAGSIAAGLTLIGGATAGQVTNSATGQLVGVSIGAGTAGNLMKVHIQRRVA